MKVLPMKSECFIDIRPGKVGARPRQERLELVIAVCIEEGDKPQGKTDDTCISTRRPAMKITVCGDHRSSHFFHCLCITLVMATKMVLESLQFGYHLFCIDTR
ncbi:hypothetical protein [Duncaniella dubosii]|uniref:hypothetical protein n=1 Tax=Duncaniella dubosii TaxID=2518971 RepID=UPI003F67191D